MHLFCDEQCAKLSKNTVPYAIIYSTSLKLGKNTAPYAII